jgi:hypothetical protein
VVGGDDAPDAGVCEVRRGARLRAYAAQWFDAQTIVRVIDPAIADLQREPRSVAGYAAVLKVFLVCALDGGVMSSNDWTADDRQTFRRAVTGVGLVTLICIFGFQVPILFSTWRPGQPIDLGALLYQAPQGFPVAISIGTMLGVIFGLDGREHSPRVIRRLLLLSCVASFLSFVDLFWRSPGAKNRV